jgi:hypothetical protein
MTKICVTLFPGDELMNAGQGRSRVFAERDLVAVDTFWNVKQLLGESIARKAAIELLEVLESGTMTEPIFIFNGSGKFVLVPGDCYDDAERVRQQELNPYAVFYRPRYQEIADLFTDKVPA